MLTDYSSQRLNDLEWENAVIKDALVKHFLGVDLDGRPSNQIDNIEDLEGTDKNKNKIRKEKLDHAVNKLHELEIRIIFSHQDDLDIFRTTLDEISKVFEDEK